MTSVIEIGQAVKSVLSVVGDKVARETGFTKRQSKLTGTKFVQTTVLGWLNKPEATLDELSQTAAAVGVTISAQGLDHRFTPEAAALLKQVLDAALSQIIAADPVAVPPLRRFNGVIVQDSSVISLPDALVQVWKGCGGSDGHHVSALKLQVRFDLLTGTLQGPLLEPGRTNDRGSAPRATPLAAKALRLADLGYFSLDQLRAFDAQDAYFLTRLYLRTAIFDHEGNRLALSTILAAAHTGQVDLPVLIGATQRLPVRLLAVRVPQEVADQRRRRLRVEARNKGETPSQVGLAFADWNILVTNVPKDKLLLTEAMVLARVRWQSELLFKLWKSHGKVDEWRTENPWRILCETYAKLIAMIVQHWLFLVGCWVHPNRSLVKAAQTVRDYALMLGSALAGYIDLAVTIARIQRCLAAGCRMNRRRKQPNTYQLLLNLPEVA
ncbi:MAG: IS4 family transposase [Chloroflexi bacterium]|nr:IS4 family transposase [Chloroflexota bacterium]MCL5108484.1 IS4 family transposase [Chloroflexota bacterium]